MSARSASRTALAALLLFLACAASAFGQGTPPLPGEIPRVQSLEVPVFLLNRNAALSNHEWAWPSGYLKLHDDVNFLVPGGRFFAPQLIFREGSTSFVAGSQLLAGATPFFDLLSYRGARLSHQDGPWNLTGWAGETENPELALISGRSSHNRLAGLTVGYRPGAYSSWGLTLMPYASRDGGGLDRTIGVFQGYLSDRRTYSILAAVGQDLGPTLPGEDAAARQALRVVATLGHGRLSASADVFRVGRLFGPPQGITDVRGQSLTNLLAVYQLDDELALIENFRVNQFETAGAAVSARTTATGWQHRLAWRPRLGLQLDVGMEQTRQEGPGAAPGSSNAFFVDAVQRVGPVTLTEDVRVQSSNNVEQLQARLRGDLPLSEDLSAYLEHSYSAVNPVAGAFSRVNQARAGLQGTFDDGRGVGQLEYVFQRVRSGGGVDLLYNRFLSASMKYRLAGTLWVTTGLGAGFSSTSTYTATAGLRWITGRNSELVLEHRFQSPKGLFQIQGVPATLGNLTTLTWQTSYGGPIQAAIDRDLRGRAIVTVEALPVGGSRYTPVAGVSVEVGKRLATTDRRGRAVATDLEAGTYEVRLPPGALSANYVLDDEPTRRIEVPAGEEARVRFHATAYASVYVIAFSDAEGSGRVETPYTPLAGIRVLVDGQAVQTTAHDGATRFARLSPGRHHIALDPAALPPGMDATTPLEQTLDLAPGQEAVVSFGLRGFGTLSGTALLIPPGSTTPTEVAPATAVLAGDRPIAQTDDAGRFEIRLPAGRHALSLDPLAIGSNRYVVGAPLAVDVQAGQSLRQDIVIAELGRVEGEVVERRPDGRLSPLRASGVVIHYSGRPSYLYTDEEGRFRLDGLRMGEHGFRLDAASLPTGLLLESPAEQTVDLASGAVARVHFVVRRTRR